MEMEIRKIIGKLQKLFSSTDTILWIWVIIMAVGLLLFSLLGKSLPGMAPETNLVFVQWWQDELEEDTLQKLIAEYEKQNSAVKITLKYRSRGEVRELLEAKDGDGKEKKPAFDVFSMEPNWIDGLEKEGILPPAEETLESPVISFINPLFYNITLLQASGFDRPPKNREELLAYARAITSQGNYGAALALAEDDPHSIGRHLLSWIWASGINLDDTSEPFRFNSRPVIDTLSFLNQLKPNLFPQPFFMTEEERQRLFAEGKIGMMIGSISEIREYREKMGGGFNVTTIPGPQAYVGKPVFVLSGWYLGVNEKSAGKEEAVKFAAFMRERSEVLAAAAFAVSGSNDQFSGLVKDDPFYSKVSDMSNAGEMIREIYKLGKSAASLELNGIIREEVKRMFDGSRTPEETAEAIQRRWETQ
jgi:ABC-type glycerol-3-phosphate transport system substrate-binding protein